jgi:hypothetical protein
MRRWAPLLGLLWIFPLAGCSHAPRPVTDAAAAPVGAPADAVAVALDADGNPDSVGTWINRQGNGVGTVNGNGGRKRAAPHPPPTTPESPAAAVVAGSSTSAPADTSVKAAAVVPQLPPDERRDLEKSSREQIEVARVHLAGLEAAKLDADQQRKLQIAQGFLSDAISARAKQDWMRASQLATKARLLAEELDAR